MGFASMLEDIRDKLVTDLRAPTDTLVHQRTEQNAFEVVKRLRELQRVSDQVLDAVERALELATNPEVDLSRRVIELQADIQSITAERDAWKARCEEASKASVEKNRRYIEQIRLENEINPRVQIAELRRELKACKSELKRTKERRRQGKH